MKYVETRRWSEIMIHYCPIHSLSSSQFCHKKHDWNVDKNNCILEFAPPVNSSGQTFT